jgi:hypothetical protein
MNGQTFRESLTNAIGYWERRRVAFNIVLAAIVLTYFAIHYPASKTVLSVNYVLILFLLAVLANIAYCAAYLVDVFAPIIRFPRTMAEAPLDPVSRRDAIRRDYHALRCDGHVSALVRARP